MASFALRSNGLSAYQSIQQDAEGRESRIQFIELLFDRLAASLAGIRHAELAGDSRAREMHWARATRIVVGLENALDPRFSKELTQNLGALYRYYLRRLNRLSRNGSAETVEELLGYTNTLRSAFLSKKER